MRTFVVVAVVLAGCCGAPRPPTPPLPSTLAWPTPDELATCWVTNTERPSFRKYCAVPADPGAAGMSMPTIITHNTKKPPNSVMCSG